MWSCTSHMLYVSYSAPLSVPVLCVIADVQIHASTINHDPDNVIRLATDLRFCDSSKPYDQVGCLVSC